LPITAYYRAKKGGRARTVSSSQVSSSKLERTPSKRSRSATNKQVQKTAIQNIDIGKLPGSDLLEHLDASQGKRRRPDNQDPDRSKHTDKHKNTMDNIRRRQLSKVETVRVLRARSGFLAPITTPPIPLIMAGIIPGPSHRPSHFQPLLNSEDRRTEGRKKKRQ